MIVALLDKPLQSLLGAGAILILCSVVSLFIAGKLLARLPHDYFRQANPQTPIRSWIVRLAKNIIGIMLISLGVVLSLPGVPGPGVVIMLLGIILSEFPGKRRLETWFIRRPGVLMTINSIRSWFNKSPLLVDPE